MSKVDVVRLQKLKYFAQKKRKTRRLDLESIAIGVTVNSKPSWAWPICAFSYTAEMKFRSLDPEIE